VGGSSAINTLAAIRGISEDCDPWAQRGCKGWSFAQVLPAFSRLEDYLDYGDQPYHGRGGPIPIYRPPLATWEPLHGALRDAALDLGYGWVDDRNAPEGTGVSPWAMNMWNGRRVSTNDADLEPARERPNLTIMGDALVVCLVRYSSRLAGAGRNDMQLYAINPVDVDEAAHGRGGLRASMVQTFSKGSVRLTTPDPAIDLEVDLRLLSDGRDLVRLRDGARRLFALAQHPAIAALTAHVWVSKTSQGIADLRDDAQIDAWLLAECLDDVHAGGTCRMGPLEEPHAVVDPEGRVRGVEGLRMVDASIVPEVPRANTHLTAVMLAEHLAEHMKCVTS
jgi:choline dehydrogenase-like flavoprotein